MQFTGKKTHYTKNYLVIFSTKTENVRKVLVNSRDELQALYLATKKLYKGEHPDGVTRARVSGKYSATKKRIEKRIGVDVDFYQ